ncbi:MAG: hypothetical protein ACOCP4_00805 [Candidatus Woesearchaeota archaeon]
MEYGIKNHKGHKERKWICEKLEDLPEARKVIELEPYRDKVIEALNEASKNHCSLDETVTKIFEVLKNA